eukprot:TRINITY_DN17868_c0_g1_i1.p1 TRINITY_DN17868_c0_g1~~TRINITY_DN17868_c0_g1_i1.p1  ORF type:complete len:164 (+),score=13.45 TRINITY_DN17868_c0_g1_i1:47-493(+)
MGGNNTKYDTVCAQGCAMSSLAMALNGRGFKMPGGSLPNPGTLNHWLRYNHGYVCIAGDCDNLVLDSPHRINPAIHFISEAEKPAIDTLRWWVIKQNPIVIAHVHDRSHFVLLTGVYTNNSTFYVNDPFYPTHQYTYDDIADVITYTL